jgi:DNA-directed RNA polymerase specialized sigma24 family protein
MRDSEAIDAIVAGDSGGLAEAFDAYGDLLYAYCRSVLGDPDATANAVQTTFVIAAAHAERLADPAHLRPWLFAVARNLCLRDTRHAPPATADMARTTVEIGTNAERALLRAAAGGLGAAEQDVIRLLWHGLDMDDMPLVLAVSRNHVYSLFSRARDQLEASVAVLLVGRHGRDDCAGLAGVLKDWDGTLTVPLRERVTRHIGQCAICSQRRERELRPAILLSLSPGALIGAAEEARAAAPLSPAWVRDRMLWLVTSYDAAAGAERGERESQAGTFGGNGFPKPRPAAPARRPRRRLLAVGAVVVVAAAAAVVAALVVPHARQPAVQVAAEGPHEIGGSLAPPLDGTGTATGTATGIATGTATGGAAAKTTTAPATNSASPSPSPRATSSAKSSPSSRATTPPASAPASPQQPQPTRESSPAAAAGSVSVSPASISVVAPFSTSVTVTASGGTVNWSVSVPASVAREISVSPASGTLLAGQQVSLSVTSNTTHSFHTTLTVNPGGHSVSVAVGFGLPLRL